MDGPLSRCRKHETAYAPEVGCPYCMRETLDGIMAALPWDGEPPQERELAAGDLSGGARFRLLAAGEVGDDQVCEIMDALTAWAGGRLGSYVLAGPPAPETRDA